MWESSRVTRRLSCFFRTGPLYSSIEPVEVSHVLPKENLFGSGQYSETCWGLSLSKSESLSLYKVSRRPRRSRPKDPKHSPVPAESPRVESLSFTRVSPGHTEQVLTQRSQNVSRTVCKPSDIYKRLKQQLNCKLKEQGIRNSILVSFRFYTPRSFLRYLFGVLHIITY